MRGDRRLERPAPAPTIRAEINVTPLVDVCLVLLIIFMVVTPIIVDGIAVTLPETAHPTALPRRENQLTLAVQRDGAVFVGQQWVPRERLTARLAALKTADAVRAVVLRADRHVRYGQVLGVMRALDRAGFAGVGLVAQRKSTADPAAGR